MVDETLTATKLSLKYKKGSFTFSRILHDAGNDTIYALAQAFNSLQDEEPAQRICKIVETRLDDYEN